MADQNIQKSNISQNTDFRKFKELSAQNNKLQIQLTNANARIESLKDQLARRKSKDQRNAELVKELTRKCSEYEKKIAELIELEVICADLQNRLNKLTAQNTVLQKLYDESVKTADKLRNSLAMAEAIYEKAVDESKQKEKTLEEVLSSYQQINGALKPPDIW